MRALILCFVAAIALHIAAGESPAVVIDFTGGTSGSAVGTIGIATFTADYAVQGGARTAFGAAAGNDTGNSGSFAAVGNVFIGDPNGDATPPNVGGFRTKSVIVDFAEAVFGLSFDVADIDWDEVFEAEVFGPGMVSLGSMMIVSPNDDPGDAGSTDGVVYDVDFGALSGITKLVITNTIPAGSPAIFPGFGVDNLEFTPVPEPSSMALLATGALGLCGYGRRRKRKVTE